MQNMFVGIDIEQLKLTQRVPLVEQERLTLPEHMSLLHNFSGVRFHAKHYRLSRTQYIYYSDKFKNNRLLNRMNILMVRCLLHSSQTVLQEVSF